MTSYRHIFFDLDGTLARSRTPISDEHVLLFLELTQHFNVLVTSGTAAEKMRSRLPQGTYWLFAENGNVAYDETGALLWRHALSPQQKELVFSLIEGMKKYLDLEVLDEYDLVEDREVQIAYSLIGHNENLEKKEAFDPNGEKRRLLLKVFHADVEFLKKSGVEVRIGGTTTLDFIPLLHNKATNIIELMEKKGWKGRDTLYVGDALYSGGNDEVMIGVVDTKTVKNPAETFDLIRSILNHES